MLLSGDKRSNAGVRNASSAPRQRSDHSSAARAGVGLDFLNFPTQQLPLEAWAHRADEDADSSVQRHSRVSSSHGRAVLDDSESLHMPPSRGSVRSGSGLSGSGRTQESHLTNMSRASTLLNDDSGSAHASRGRSGRIQVPDVMMGTLDAFDSTAVNSGAATARSERHLLRELSELKQQYQFAAVQHREDMNIMRSKLTDMQHQLSQANTSRDEAFEAIQTERAVASLRVQESDSAQRQSAKLAQQLREKLQLEEQRSRDLMQTVDSAQKDLEKYKLKLQSLEEEHHVHLQKLLQHEQQHLDFQRQTMTAEQTQQKLHHQLQQERQHHQQQTDILQSQLRQQLQAVQKDLSAAQLSLIDSERQRSDAEAQSNRNVEELSVAKRQLQTLQAELQSAQSARVAVTTEEIAQLQQKLQLTQDRLETVQSHSKSQIDTAQGLYLSTQNEVLRLQAELSTLNGSLASAQSQNQFLQQQILVLTDNLKSSAAASSSAAAALAASEVRSGKLGNDLEEQQTAHLLEIRRIRDEQTALRESAAQAEGRFLELQSKLAAEAVTASTDRLRLAESLSKTEALTSLNHKLTAALAVVQLRAAVGVQDLLSQAGLSALSSKTPQQRALFLESAKGLLQSAREENAKLGFATAAGPGSALESAVKIMNAQ